MTKKTDVDAVAQGYLRNNVNAYINPYHSLWYPGYVNTAHLEAFTTAPELAVPSQNTLLNETQLRGSQVRAAIIQLGNYYSRVTRGYYGLLNTSGASTSYTFSGTGYFSIKNTSPGMGSKIQNVVNALNAIPAINGTLQYAQLTNNYSSAWSIIYNSRDELTVDLTVCHSSCHSSCHGSRGRR